MSKVYLYPLPVRLWHILNALFCKLLILTGISMQYLEWFQFITFDWSVFIHNIAGILLSVNYVLFLLVSIRNGNLKNYHWQWKGLISKLSKQTRYYLGGIFKGEKEPFPIGTERKFNPLQLIIYWKLMFVFFPLVIISGLMMLYPEYFLFTIQGIRALLFVDGLHIVAGFFITIFFFIHLYLALMGGKKNLKAIKTGWHDL